MSVAAMRQVHIYYAVGALAQIRLVDQYPINAVDMTADAAPAPSPFDGALRCSVSPPHSWPDGKPKLGAPPKPDPPQGPAFLCGC